MPNGRSEPLVVNHVGHCVTDLDRSTRFYVDVLGFEVERELSIDEDAAAALLAVEPPVGLRVRYLRSDRFVLELLHFDRSGNPPGARRVFNEPGLTHLSLCAEDVAAVVERAEKFGGSVITAMLPMAAMIRDPDGQILEILPMTYRRSVEGG